MQMDLTVASDNHKSKIDHSSHTLFPPHCPKELSLVAHRAPAHSLRIRILAVQSLARLPNLNDFTAFSRPPWIIVC